MATKSANRAEAEQVRAEDTQDKAFLSQSKFLTEMAEQQTKGSKPVTGMLLALEAIPDASNASQMQRDRPYWPPTEAALHRALYAMRERPELLSHEGSASSVVVSPDNTFIVTGSDDNTARICKVFEDKQALIDYAKTIVPRCLTKAQRQLFYLAPEPPQWCLTAKKRPYHNL